MPILVKFTIPLVLVGIICGIIIKNDRNGVVKL